MLKENHHLMVGLLVLADGCAVAVSWVGSYWFRFNYLAVDPAKGVPDFSGTYLVLLPAVVLIHLLIFSRLGLYLPRRDQPIVNETRDIVKAFMVAVIAVILVDYFLPKSNKISRVFVLTYAVAGTTCFALFRGAVRAALHALRRRGWNRRTAAIIGSGRTAQRLHYALGHNAWTGIETLFFVDHHPSPRRGELCGLPLLGPLEHLKELIERCPVDAVFVALPSRESHRTAEVLDALESCMADIRIVPEVDHGFSMYPTVSELDGVPVLSLRQTPLYGWNALQKRAFDLIVGLACLAIAIVPMIVIAILVKVTSRGPVFYKQRRMGLDGCEFTLIKFRTMRDDAEAETGPVWAEPDDPRRTRVGAFLRRTSLDELPNLFNVIAGQMSLVGPRPERPELIEQFKRDIPRYMLRHKMKAGMTGFAQVRGLRGKSSLKKRIQHDVHYICNWSLGLDMRILLQTLTGAWFSRHEM